jgi:class 3 adenylate cyclase
VSERLDRQLAAVMFTDIVGYTALMQADERLGLDKRDRYMRALECQHETAGFNSPVRCSRPTFAVRGTWGHAPCLG